jgi:hypothetical protein
VPDQPQDALPMGLSDELEGIHGITLLRTEMTLRFSHH